jgi:hypothetical protein
MNKIVAYYQPLQPSAANLDLDAQRQFVRTYAHDIQTDITAEFTEHAGSKKDTLELMRALKACNESKAKLVVAQVGCLPGTLTFITTALLWNIECLALNQPRKEYRSVSV